ncbi:MAG: serine/threonine protein kinase, partial [Saprospiraceae bacterium]|nr:serine/threonine protein kinase [Saprospiraceae bacterium]
VFKAVHLSTGRKVAIKSLNIDGDITRFRNEARIQSSLQHPNIAELYEYIIHEGTPYIIMEYVRGINLSDLIKRKGVTGKDHIRQLMIQITGAVAYLHERGIIHRDLKPSNIKINEHGQVKLIDFGISKGLSSPKITKTGFMVGTIDYAAPERFKGQNHPQSDVWSIGAIFYELLSNQSYITRGQTDKVIAAIQDKNHLKRKIERIDDSYAPIIKKCLAPNYKSRYKDGLELLAALGMKKEKSKSIQAPTLDLVQNKWWMIAAIVMILAIVSFYPDSDPDDIQHEATIELLLYPRNSTVTLPDGKVLKHGNKIEGNYGDQIKATMKAEGYDSKDIILSFSTSKEFETLEYILQK